MNFALLVVAVGIGVVGVARAAQAQPSPLVGFLSPVSPAAASANVQAFRQGLAEAGLVEARSVRVEYLFAGGTPEPLAPLTEELVALSPAVIVVGTGLGCRIAHQATRTVPIVCATMLEDPVADGLVASLARPGGNVTGFSLAVDLGTIGKRIEIIKETVPGLVRLAALVNPEESGSKTAMKYLPAATAAMGITLEFIPVRHVAELAAAVAAAQGRADALFVSESPTFFNNRAELATLIARARLPAIYNFREFAEAGGLIAFGPSLPDLYRRAADYVAKILKGARPGELPVQQASKFDLVVNLKTTAALGLTIPPAVLERADEVIE